MKERREKKEILLFGDDLFQHPSIHPTQKQKEKKGEENIYAIFGGDGDDLLKQKKKVKLKV